MSPFSKLKNRFIGYLYVVLGSGFSRGMSLASSVIVARTLGPTQFGLFSIFYVTMVLTWQLPQAFDTSYIRYAKTSRCAGEKKEFLKTAILQKFLYACIVLGVSYPLSSFLANYCFYKPETHTILMVSLFCGVFLSFLMTIASVFQEKERFGIFTILNSFYTASVLFTLLFFMVSKYELTLETVVFVHLIAAVIVGVASIIVLFKKTGNIFRINVAALKKSFSLGKWIFGVGCAFFIFQRLDVLFLTRYVDFESIGIYSAASQIIMIVSLMTGALSGVSLPRACTIKESSKAFKAFTKESFCVIATINVFILVLYFVSPFFIRLLYGNEYLFAASIMKVLLIGWLFAVFYTPFSFLFYVFDDSRVRFLLELFKVALAVLLLYWLVPMYGLLGGAISMSIALSVNASISIIILCTNNKYRGVVPC
ncbi:MAG: Polysacc synt protein [Candidatus Brocadiaceae bacterium]|nr:Polysacc synt protein [Candidatus Brocadiaceae bacterium]